MSHCEQRVDLQSEVLMGLVAGMLYGATNVLVGHPFDTVKTKLQCQDRHMGTNCTMRESAKQILTKEGLPGFYRGANAIILGTMVQRGLVMSAYELVYNQSTDTSEIAYSGGVQKRTVLSGMCAGLLRSIIECPFEYVKVRQMTGQPWRVHHIYKGFSTLAPRSTIILTSFFVQVDCWQRHTQVMDSKLGQFLASGSAALLSYWLVWPFEVLRNVTQADVRGSGNSTLSRARFIYSQYGLAGFYRGIWPGSQSVFLRNGSSMIAMLMFQKQLTQAGFRDQE